MPAPFMLFIMALYVCDVKKEQMHVKPTDRLFATERTR